MSQAAEVNNEDRYKSYIQKRRVDFDSYVDDSPTESKSEKSPIRDIEDLSLFKENKTYEGFFGCGRGTGDENRHNSSFDDIIRYRNERFRTDNDSSKLEEEDKGGASSFSRLKSYSYPSNYSGRMDTSIYQRKRSNSYGASNRTAIEENKATLLAIKIIKQALACFAILGLIVFLQQRADTAGALMFIKSQVVDNHTEVSTLVSGVENIIAECSRLFGGSP